MFFRILICLILLIIGHQLIAQDRPTEATEPAPTTRKASHYIGLQANQLLRQLISFGGNSTPVNNPYLLTYSVNSKANGFGFSTGLGASAATSQSNDNFITVSTKSSDLAWRFGLEQKKYLSKHWLIGFGADVLVEWSKSETTSQQGIGNPQVKITTKTNRSGFGPRASIAFQFHDRLLVGTEGAYYFKWGKQEQTSMNSGQPNNNGDNKIKSLAFALPTAIFLTLKF
jgi:hypothetical protein